MMRNYRRSVGKRLKQRRSAFLSLLMLPWSKLNNRNHNTLRRSLFRMLVSYLMRNRMFWMIWMICDIYTINLINLTLYLLLSMNQSWRPLIFWLCSLHSAMDGPAITLLLPSRMVWFPALPAKNHRILPQFGTFLNHLSTCS